MQSINRLCFIYVSGVLGAIDSYAKWCEWNSNTEREGAILVLLPVGLFACLMFSIPEPLRQVIAGLLIAPPVFLAISFSIEWIRNNL